MPSTSGGIEGGGVNHSGDDVSIQNTNELSDRKIEARRDDMLENRSQFATKSRHHTTRKKTKRRKLLISLNVSATKYEIVRKVAHEFGNLSDLDEDPSCFLFWNDTAVPNERIAELKPYQRINHFPAMGEICRKDCLARNLAKMMKVHPHEYNFSPKTWIFPAEYSAFQCYVRELKRKNKKQTFIVKPSNGSMGQGISLFRNGERIQQQDHTIVQEYLDRPFLLEGYKFDLRIYVLVTSCDPLRVFLFNDGLVRLSTQKYASPSDGNVEQLYMHLTNYSINKRSENFQRNEDVTKGSKRSIQFFNDYLRKNDYDVAAIWKSIADVINKTLIVSEPHVLHAYRMCRPGTAGNDSVCFEILGFDIFLDKSLKPWLLEINRAPSFGTDEKIDLDIKGALLHDAFRLINMKPSDRRKGMAAQKAESRRRLFRPSKRLDLDLTDIDRRKIVVDRRKEELKQKLISIRRDNAREDFENCNMGRYQRIFPPPDKSSQDRYRKLISDAFNIFLAGRAASLQKEIAKLLNGSLREDEIIDMLQACDIEDDGKQKLFKGPKPLSSMPSVVDEIPEYDSRASSPISTSTHNSVTDFKTRLTASQSQSQLNKAKNPIPKRPQSAQKLTTSSRPHSAHLTSAFQRTVNRKNQPYQLSASDGNLSEISTSALDREEEMMRKTLMALNDMRIKFPGKTDEEADIILNQIQENWKYHKPRIASYWLVKLDSIKRRKVIDIVRSNVRSVLQKMWRCPDIESLKLWRIFYRLFNRLLWSHGQGLWNCFSSNTSCSWDTIFHKNKDSISGVEFMCCERVIELCCQCLLIVYQFAAEAKLSMPSGETYSPTKQLSSSQLSNSRTSPWLPSSPHKAMTPVSQRMSRLYLNKSLDNLAS
ncbi:tubulin polyglutamylase TTLL7-like [Antedon mediterranea]|uniref:tubulin polyglutamylase TTLL7-like n=1 Tax=Antedon mediterranea TaxID=105859 RepID=UPI003AF6BB5D